MAKEKRRLSAAEEEEQSAVFLEEEELPQEIRDIMTQEGAGDYKIYAVRIPPNSNRPETIPETFYGGSEFEPASIAKEYGGGRYTFTMHKPNGEYLKRWTKNYASKQNGVNTTAPIQAIQQVKDESAKQLIEILNKQMEHTREESKNAMQQMFQTMTAMFSAMKSQAPQQPAPQADPLDTLVKLKSLFPDNNGGNSTSQTIEALKIGLSLAKDSKGEGNTPLEEKLIMKLVDVIAPSLEKKLQGGIMGKTKNPPVRLPPQKIENNILPDKGNGGTLENASSDPDAKILDYIRQNLKVFINYATKDAPVEPVGDFIYNSLSEEDFDNLVLFLQAGGQDKLLNTFPELIIHKDWVARLIEDLCHSDEPQGGEPHIDVIDEGGGSDESRRE